MMDILILNSATKGSDFDKRVNLFASSLEDNGDNSVVVHLNELTVIPCTGCFSCWVKTPGQCIFPDETIELREKIMMSQQVILASPLRFGFLNSDAKKIMDKLIPLLLPYITFVNNECHHKKRYKTYPEIAVLFEPEPLTDHEDISILTDIMRRFALNFRSNLVWIKDITQLDETKL